MRNASPFVHAWVLPTDIDQAAWESLRRELISVLRTASSELEQHRRGDNLAMLRGPNGFGPLVIQAHSIAFNGNSFLGQSGEPFLIERQARLGIIARRGTNDARRAVRRCDTQGHPYDLAVCAALIALSRHLGDEARVGTSGTLRTGWSRAAEIVRAATGENGQLVQQENGVIRWIAEAPRGARPSRSA